jgi:hypothetical protein
VIKSARQVQTLSGGLLGSTNLIERLLCIRKRKQAFGGQAADMVAIQHRIRTGQRGKRQA